MACRFTRTLEIDERFIKRAFRIYDILIGIHALISCGISELDLKALKSEWLIYLAHCVYSRRRALF